MKSLENPDDKKELLQRLAGEAMETILRERLYHHPGSIRSERAFHVRSRTDRIAHVVQAVEERDQVEGPRIILGGGALEDGAIGDALFARYFAGAVD